LQVEAERAPAAEIPVPLFAPALLGMNRLTAALIAYAILGVLAWWTISDTRIRAVPLGILVLFAVKSVLRRKDVMHPDGESDAE
jgi:hypothetical protein